MKVRYGEEVANHSGPKSCGGARESVTEALTGETGGLGIEPRNQESGMPTLLSEAEGRTKQGGNCKSCDDPARSKTPCTPGSFLLRSWEISFAPALYGRAGQER